VGLLWRLRAREEVTEAEEGALYVVAITLFLLAVYITCQGIQQRSPRELIMRSYDLAPCVC
jgi:hypothetical protein